MVREYKFGGGNFSRCGGWGMSKFLAGERDSYKCNIHIHIKNVWQQVFIYDEEAPCTLHTSCAQTTILLLKDMSTLCVTDIYGIYFHFSVECL